MRIPTEIAVGPVWLPRGKESWSEQKYADGGWTLTIERTRIIGRLGWQRVTEVLPAISSGTGE